MIDTTTDSPLILATIENRGGDEFHIDIRIDTALTDKECVRAIGALLTALTTVAVAKSKELGLEQEEAFNTMMGMDIPVQCAKCLRFVPPSEATAMPNDTHRCQQCYPTK